MLCRFGFYGSGEACFTEGNEFFFVTLSNASAGALIDRNIGVGTIVDVSPAPAFSIGEEVFVCLRPEDIGLGKAESGSSNGLAGTIRHSAYLGSITDYVIALEPALRST